MTTFTKSMVLAGGILSGISSHLMANELLPLSFSGDATLSGDLLDYFVAKAGTNSIVFDDIFGIENPTDLVMDDDIDDYGIQYVNYGYSVEGIIAYKDEFLESAVGNSGSSITCSIASKNQCWIKNPDKFILGGPLANELMRLMGKYDGDKYFVTTAFQGPDLELIVRNLDKTNNINLACRYSPSYFSKVVCKIVKGDKLF
ncbi:MAG: hypothetical protein KBD78_09560 [Oligoflexales bacterium]|nr:hypothetical protein [Oligoflexales bacterium]